MAVKAVGHRFAADLAQRPQRVEARGHWARGTLRDFHVLDSLLSTLKKTFGDGRASAKVALVGLARKPANPAIRRSRCKVSY